MHVRAHAHSHMLSRWRLHKDPIWTCAHSKRYGPCAHVKSSWVVTSSNLTSGPGSGSDFYWNQKHLRCLTRMLALEMCWTWIVLRKDHPTVDPILHSWSLMYLDELHHQPRLSRDSWMLWGWRHSSQKVWAAWFILFPCPAWALASQDNPHESSNQQSSYSSFEFDCCPANKTASALKMKCNL